MKDEKQIPGWLRKKMNLQPLTNEEFGQMLEAQITAGEITPDEAEDEYQSYVRQYETTFHGVYGW